MVCSVYVYKGAGALAHERLASSFFSTSLNYCSTLLFFPPPPPPPPSLPLVATAAVGAAVIVVVQTRCSQLALTSFVLIKCLTHFTSTVSRSLDSFIQRFAIKFNCVYVCVFFLRFVPIFLLSIIPTAKPIRFSFFRINNAQKCEKREHFSYSIYIASDMCIQC